MRWLVLTLAAVLALPAPAGAQVAWAKAYEDGIKALEDGNYAIAEQKLIEARDHSRAPDQARRANFSSVVFKPFVPDLYLGVIAERRGRHAEAKQILERVLSAKLITEGERKEYALANGALQEAQVALNRSTEKPADTRLADNRPVNPPPTNPPKSQQPPPTTTTTAPINPITPTPSANTGTAPSLPPVRPPPANTEPAWLAGFRRAMNASRASLQQARYAEARSNLAAATSLPVDAARRQEADALGREIDSAQSTAAQQVVERARQAIRRKDATAATSELTALRGLSPGHVAIGELTRGINSLVEGLDRTARLANAERTGVKLFLSGQYKQAGDILEQAVNQSLASPRVHLFLASSRGAQALLAPQDQRPALVAAARKHYDLAKPDAGTLTADQRFISPSILELLKGG
jgi:tetratricopeptide (TPR) repeat protein